MPSTVRGSHSGELAADVVIVGAGLAGLAAAHHLTRSGLEVAVLEAADRPGGRMATDEVDGFRLDRTLHLLNTAFPELHRTPGLDSLRLRPFTAGVLVGANGSGRPVPGGLGKAVRTGFRSTGGALSATRAVASAARAVQSRRDGTVEGFLDRARLAAALARLAGVPPQRLLTRPEQPAAQAIAARGLPARTLRGRVRPLLAALLSDPALDTSSRCADLALRSFVLGRLCLPEGGAGAVPRLLADGLPRGTVRTGLRAVSVSTTAVRTAAHGTLHCRAVLVATGARAAAELLPGLRLPGFHPVTVLHHTAPAPPEPAAALRIARGGDGPVAHSAVVSAVDPVRAPAGRTLIASTVLGAAAREPLGVLDKESRDQLGALYGTPAHGWELVGAHHDPEAVPAMPVPHDLHRPVRVLCGLYVCGDHRDTSSPQGALHSARRAARAVLQDFGLRPERAAIPVAA